MYGKSIECSQIQVENRKNTKGEQANIRQIKPNVSHTKRNHFLAEHMLSGYEI